MRFPLAQSGIEATLEQLWPVGSLYVSISPTNPALLFGFGTWAAFGAGRCLVGVDPGDTNFDAAEKTAGSKTVALTEAQLPAHSHGVTDPGHAHVEQVNSATTGGLSGFAARDTSTNTPAATDYSTASAQTGMSIQNTGGGQAHPNVQPSIAVYFFKRTA